MPKAIITNFSQAEMMTRALDITRRADAGELIPETDYILNYLDPLDAYRAITPERFVLLQTLQQLGTVSVHFLAQELERHYNIVYADIMELLKLNLVAHTPKGVSVPWDAIEWRLTIASTNNLNSSEQTSNPNYAFAEFLEQLFLPVQLPGVELPIKRNSDETSAMLSERVKEWTEDWRQQGLKQGIEQGLNAERDLLLRQTRRRFDVITAGQLQPLLAVVNDPEQLAIIGEWLIDCADGAAFLQQAANVVNNCSKNQELSQ
jgi:predicted transcriptional regulator